MAKHGIMLLSVVSLLSACATFSVGPTVMVLPGVGKPFELFQTEAASCRQFAQAQTGISPGEAATRSTLNGAAIGTAIGAGVGAAIGAATGRPDVGAAVGAGGGLLLGATEGARVGAIAAGTLQWRYDMAYVQCMYAKGHQVPGMASPPASSYVPPPPPNAPPPPPASMVRAPSSRKLSHY